MKNLLPLFLEFIFQNSSEFKQKKLAQIFNLLFLRFALKPYKRKNHPRDFLHF